MRFKNKRPALFITTIVGTTAPLIAAELPTNKKGESKQPNVIFIMVDDFGWADVGYNGSTFYETPNIDRLAKSGMEFTDGYAAASISSPSRVALMTGKYPARTTITDWIPGYQYNKTEEQLSKYRMISPDMPLDMPLEEVTIAEAFKKNGYNTYHIGKWHCAEHDPYYPHYQGFDQNIGGWLKGSPNGNNRSRGGEGAYNTPYNNPYLTDGPDGEFLTDRLANEGVDIINNSGDDPFFMYLAFYAVHTPVEPKLDVVEHFKAKAKEMGIDDAKEFDDDSKLYDHWSRKPSHWRERIIQSDPEYAALIYTMDENVGKVLDALEQKGILDNTIVCLMGDNGGLSTAEGSHTTNAPLRAGKGWLYDGGIRVPFIISYPDMVKAGSVCNTPVVGVDFYPTLLDAAGLPLKPEQHLDGVSLLPLLKGKKEDRGALFFHYPHYGGKGDAPAGAIREGDYKLIEFFEDGRIELYNMKKDISESNNIAEEEPKIAASMLKKLHKWREDTGAKMAIVNSGYLD